MSTGSHSETFALTRAIMHKRTLALLSLWLGTQARLDWRLHLIDGECEVRKKVLGLRFWVSQDQSWGWKQHLLYPSLDSTYHPGARRP